MKIVSGFSRDAFSGDGGYWGRTIVLEGDMSRVGMAAVVMAALGCRYRAEVVPVWGDASGLRHMAGEWTGDYSSPDSHRRGVITFALTARGDSAFGEVIMDADGEAGAEFSRPGPVRTPLAIQFVRIADGSIRGELEPYLAPDCECLVRTLFTGIISGEVVSGSFRTTTEWGGKQEGSWRAIRAKAVAPEAQRLRGIDVP